MSGTTVQRERRARAIAQHTSSEEATMTYTKEQIQDKLANDDRWLVRGMLAIYKFQTADEKACETTIEENGVGFNAMDANILSSFCEQYNERGFLTPKQLDVARKCMRKYAGQLVRIANANSREA